LDEAIRIALQRNTSLEKGKNNISTYEAGVKSAWGNFMPSLNANGGFGWTRSDQNGTTRNLGGFVIDVPATVSESRNYNAGVNSSITLFDGLSSFANLDKSRNDLESAQLQLERLKQNLVFQTVSLYYDVINNQQLLKVKEDNVKWNQKNLETVTERNKLGAVTLADVYAQQVQTGNAELDVIRTRNMLENSKSTLLDYLGLDVFDDYNFADVSIKMDELSTENTDELSVLVNSALTNRFDYKSAQLGLASAFNSVTMARAGHMPSLSGSFGFSTYANNFNTLFENKNYSAGISLNIPIFNGFGVSERVQFAEVGAMNKKVELTELERTIKVNLQKTYLDLQAAKKAVDVSQRNVKSSTENRKIEEEKYSLGSGTLLNVLIANSEFTVAQTNLINAQYAYETLKEQLKYYIGVLDYKSYE
ncbi:MAG: TolC family protein, partial [Ignavibacteriaceae bacterium]|nr:TolC family protein [Ignavibacteriaceae bacterium]